MNPYLALAACLQAGLDGIEKEMELPPCIQGNLFGMEPETLKNKHVERIPETLGDAIEAYRDNSFIREILGRAYLCQISGSKRRRVERFQGPGH